MPQGITEEDLQNLFGPYGNILTKKLLRDQGGKIKGIAFIRLVVVMLLLFSLVLTC